MGIRFRFTKNRWLDALRFLLAGGFFFLLATLFWNRSTTSLKPLEAGYQGFFLEGKWSDRILNSEGVIELKRLVEDRTRPTYNPFVILSHHHNISRDRSGYDLVIGLRPEEKESILQEFAIYQKGNIIYLQSEPVGIDRVLTASITPEALEEALAPYIEGEFHLSFKP